VSSHDCKRGLYLGAFFRPHRNADTQEYIVNYYFGKVIQDGVLGPEVGRIVIYRQYITHSTGPSRDHNDLLRSLAAQFGLDKDQVIAQAARFYWKPWRDGIVISPVRKIDSDDFYQHQLLYTRLLQKEIP
jgi:hypothetical protein